MTPTIQAHRVPHDIKQSLEQRFQRAVFRTHNPFDVAKAYEGMLYDPDLKAKWEMIEALGKASMTGHFDAEIIREARFEIR
jgi:hypothetical protein